MIDWHLSNLYYYFIDLIIIFLIIVFFGLEINCPLSFPS